MHGKGIGIPGAVPEVEDLVVDVLGVNSAVFLEELAGRPGELGLGEEPRSVSGFLDVAVPIDDLVGKRFRGRHS